MSEGSKPPWYRQLPAKAGAVVVFLVAVTTLLGNVLELDEKRRAPTPAATTATPAPAPVAAAPMPAATPAAGAQKVRLTLDRIVVEHDGTPGTTDWRFTIEAEGQPVLTLQQDGLDDTGGRNVALPVDAATTVSLADGKTLPLLIKGWRGSLFRLPGAGPDATGRGVLVLAHGTTQLRVTADKPQAGDFVFHLSADAR